MSERTVIIVGKGLTARELPEWIERYPTAKVWRLNDDLRYSDRCDRMYQLHDKSDIPVDSEWERIVHPSKLSLGNCEMFGFKPLSSPRMDHMSNTICYMLYHALAERYNHIVMVGCDFLVDRIERDEELPHVMWWMGYLDGLGVTFDGPKASAIFHKASYPPTTD